MTSDPRYAASSRLAARAERLMPGGHHLSGRPLLRAKASPRYFTRASGAHIWDVDGRAYVDFLMAYGPFLLGYAHREVDAAAFRQAGEGMLVSLNHPLHLDFVEALVGIVPSAEMGVFFRTGSEATTAALRIARRATGRKLVARCGYHGWHDWCLPEADFVPAGLTEQVFVYEAMKPETLRALLEEHAGRFAAVILAPEMVHPPNRETVAELVRLAREHGALFIMDEVKTGIRMPGWTMQAFYGVEPDLTTLSKALGNGWPIAATLGPAAIMREAAGMHLSATYHGDVAAMAAAMKTLEVVARDGAQEAAWSLGERLLRGLQRAVERHAIPAVPYGEPIPSMPFLRFNNPDPAVNDALSEFVYGEALRQGILLHPRHLWFTSAAHSTADIDLTVEVVDAAFAQARRLGLADHAPPQAEGGHA